MPAHKKQFSKGFIRAPYFGAGFTLIELLVTISIIAILSVVGIVAYGNVQKNARDARRKADIDAIATALEQRYSPYTHTYPILDDGMFQSGIPLDPENTGEYKYSYALSASSTSSYTFPSSDFSTYIFCAKLENANGNAGDANGTNATGTGADYYCRKNLQAF